MENQKERIPKEALAVYQSPYNGARTAYMPTINGGLYRRYLDYKGIFLWGTTSDSSKTVAPDEKMEWIKTPQTPYHVWHICFCPKCTKSGGRIWSHSQADWDNHLRYVDNGDVFTYPTVTE